MELPPNTLPMMAGHGQFGPIGMGGMLTVLKVRANQPPNDYRDPGPYAFPSGTVAFEYRGPVPEAVRPPSPPQAAHGEVRRGAHGGMQGGMQGGHGGGAHGAHGAAPPPSPSTPAVPAPAAPTPTPAAPAHQH